MTDTPIDDKIIPMSKFKLVVSNVKKALGMKIHEPTMYIDAHTLMCAFSQTPIFKELSKLKMSGYSHYEWSFDISEGQLQGVTVTLFDEDERGTRS